MEAAVANTNPQIDFTNPGTCRTVVAMGQRAKNAQSIDLEEAVRDHYKAVYRFAYSLSRNPSDAADLTQYAYERLAMKWQQITDPSKVKGWLNSTLYRKFVDQKRRITRFPEVELNEEWSGQTEPSPESGDRIDAQAAVEGLFQLEEDLRAPLALFYLDACSYKEIARLLELPIGTVMSRLHRGKTKLYQLLTR